MLGQLDGAHVVDVDLSRLDLGHAHLGQDASEVHGLERARGRGDDLGLGGGHADARLLLAGVADTRAAEHVHGAGGAVDRVPVAVGVGDERVGVRRRSVVVDAVVGGARRVHQAPNGVQHQLVRREGDRAREHGDGLVLVDAHARGLVDECAGERGVGRLQLRVDGLTALFTIESVLVMATQVLGRRCRPVLRVLVERLREVLFCHALDVSLAAELHAAVGRLGDVEADEEIDFLLAGELESL